MKVMSREIQKRLCSIADKFMMDKDYESILDAVWKLADEFAWVTPYAMGISDYKDKPEQIEGVLLAVLVRSHDPEYVQEEERGFDRPMQGS